MKDHNEEGGFYEPSGANAEDYDSEGKPSGNLSPVSKMNHPRQPQEEDEGGSFYYRSSPLPDPEDLRKYNEIVPGFAKDILDSYVILSSEEVKHRREMEKKHLALHEKSLVLEEKNLDIHGEIARENSKRSNAGLYTCFAVLVLLIGCGYYATSKGQKTIAVTIFGGAMSALVINYASVIYGTRKIRQSENDSKVLENPKELDNN